MRIWSIHPKYLDAKGLVALWRETLLAQKVLLGKTVGYRNHPQLDRFKIQADAVSAIGKYLRSVQREAEARDYRFDASKIVQEDFRGRIPVTRGQLEFEWVHFRKKARLRDPGVYAALRDVEFPEAHPLFRIVEGGIEPWEKG